jgi:hypothetical protein
MALHEVFSDGIHHYHEHGQRPPGMGGSGYADQCDFAESARRIAGGDGGGVPRDVVARLDVYNDGSPEDYIPDLRFANMRGTEYEPYEVVFEQAPPNIPQITGDVPPNIDEPPIHYSDCRMTQGLFEHLMKEEGFDPAGRLDIESISEAPADPEPMSADSGLEEIAHGAVPLEEPELRVSLPPCSMAESGQYDHFDQSPSSDLPSAPADYAAIDPQDFFEQQRRMIDFGIGPLDRGSPMEMEFLDQIVLSDPSQQMLLSPEPHIPWHIGPGFGPDVPPTL